MMSLAGTLELKEESVGQDIVDLYKSLSETQYAGQLSSDRQHLVWKFQENPAGAAIGHNLYSDGRLIGRLVFQPRSFFTPTGTKKAAYLVDLLIDPRYRSFGTFARLVSRVGSLLSRFDFLYVTPNSTSMELYAKVLRWPELEEMSGVAFPTRLTWMSPKGRGRFVWPIVAAGSVLWTWLVKRASNLLGKVEIVEKMPTDEEVQRLLERVKRYSGMIGSRDAGFLHWRFSRRSRIDYRVRCIMSCGRLVGYYVLRKMPYNGKTVTMLVDCVLDPDLPGSRLRNIRWRLIRESLEDESDFIFGLFGVRNDLLQRLCKFPLLVVPRKLLPQAVRVFFHSRHEVDHKRPFMTIADLDVF